MFKILYCTLFAFRRTQHPENEEVLWDPHALYRKKSPKGSSRPFHAWVVQMKLFQYALACYFFSVSRQELIETLYALAWAATIPERDKSIGEWASHTHWIIAEVLG